MKERKVLFLVFAILLHSGMQAAAQYSSRTTLTQAQWTEDINFFVKNFSAAGKTVDFSRGITLRGQIDFGRLYPKETFYPAAEDLKAHLAGRSDSSIALNLMHIVASAKVGHNTIYAGRDMGFSDVLPVGFRWFPDGVAVVSSTTQYRQLVGKRVITIGGQGPEQIETHLGVYISAETKRWLQSKLQSALSVRPYLEAIDAVERDGTVMIELADDHGNRQTVRLPFLADSQKLISWYVLRNVEPPLRNAHPERNYWFRRLESSHSVYIQYRRCAQDSTQHFSDFVHSTMEEIDRVPVDRVIVDLRGNRGGNSLIIHSLVQVLEERPVLRGRIFTLIDTDTFSSGLQNAIDLKEKLHATLIGEPTGENVDSYGEVKQFTLPNSKLVVQFSTKHIHAPETYASGPLRPNLVAPLTIAAYFSGIDPALEAAEKAVVKE